MPKFQVTNVEVTLHSEGGPYSLSCTLPDARYHVWLTRVTLEPEAPTIYKNSHAGYREPGHFTTRTLKLDSKFGKELYNQMRAVAVAGELFKKAEQHVLDEKERQQAAGQERVKIRRAQEAGPELLEALQALMGHVENGTLVRDVSCDWKPDWGKRSVAFVIDLKKAYDAIQKAKHGDAHAEVARQLYGDEVVDGVKK